MPVSYSSVLSLPRRAATGMALATILSATALMSAGSAAAGESAGWPKGPTLETADDTLFPLGKPPALIEATGSVTGNPRLWLESDTLSLMDTDRMSTGAILSVRQLASMSAFSLPGMPGRVMPAERHIVIGLMLLAAAGMAGFSFGLWRWQVRGLAVDA
jgi:hypothetical protein